MQQDPLPGPLDGIRRHPVETWIGVYDPETFERLEFRRAPNSGRVPAVRLRRPVRKARYSYLFGNSNQLNLAIEGGYDNGPFSATRMYLARVPRGRFLDEPEYYTGSGLVAAPRTRPSDLAAVLHREHDAAAADRRPLGVGHQEGRVPVRHRSCSTSPTTRGVRGGRCRERDVRPTSRREAGVVPAGPDAVAGPRDGDLDRDGLAERRRLATRRCSTPPTTGRWCSPNRWPFDAAAPAF